MGAQGRLHGAVELQCVLELSVGQELGQMRAVPVWLDEEGPPALLLVYGADAEDDPYHEMFFFPRDTLKLMLIGPDGRRLWHRDLGRGVVPGVWFCPVFPFDLNGDGEVLDADGNRLGRIEGQVAMVGRFLDRPGEQVLAYAPDGTVRAYADANARDSDAALRRRENPLYRANQRLSATGYNINVLGGL